jgi:hypothetical protein
MSNGDEEWPAAREFRRDWRRVALSYIASVCVVSVAMLLFIWIAVTPPSRTNPPSFLEFVGGLGATAAADLLSAMGVIATLLVASFVAIVSGQVVGREPDAEVRLREAVTALSALSLIAISPAVVAVILSVPTRPEDVGSLLVIVPAYGVLLAIAILIEVINQGGEHLRYHMAVSRMRRAQQQLARLEGLPRAGAWRAGAMVWLVLALLAWAVAIGVALVLGSSAPASAGEIGQLVALFAFGTGLCVFMLIATNTLFKIKCDLVDVVMGSVLIVVALSVYLLCTLLAAEIFVPAGIGMTVVAVPLLALLVSGVKDANRVRRGERATRDPRFLTKATTRAGTGWAWRVVTREKMNARAEAMKLEPAVAPPEEPAPTAQTASRTQAASRTQTASRWRRALIELLREE